MAYPDMADQLYANRLRRSINGRTMYGTPYHPTHPWTPARAVNPDTKGK
jgi:hypothetical protein